MVIRKMLARLSILTLFFLISSVQGDTHSATEVEGRNGNSFYALLEDKLEIKIGEFVNYFTKWLADFNDRHLGASNFGRLIHYDDIKPTLEEDTGRSKMGAGRMKKMSMAMMPLVFHVGATSTWMLITSLMAAKSVAIGMALLIFKIAVSSAKLASFFTLLKGKYGDHHHGWSWSPPPHYEHHGHERSFKEIEQHINPTGHQAWHSYSPEWTPETQEYHTIPSNYHRGEIDASYPKAEDRKKKLP